jgi:hypothetical protein
MVEIASSAWANISFHAMNTVFLVIEFVFGRMRLHWGYLLFCLMVMSFYLALDYVVHAVDNVWGTHLPP